jgi:hypothetical protein
MLQASGLGCQVLQLYTPYLFRFHLLSITASLPFTLLLVVSCGLSIAFTATPASQSCNLYSRRNTTCSLGPKPIACMQRTCYSYLKREPFLVLKDRGAGAAELRRMDGAWQPRCARTPILLAVKGTVTLSERQTRLHCTRGKDFSAEPLNATAAELFRQLP